MQFSKINESNETALLNQNPPHFKTVRKVIFFQYKNVLTDVSISRTIKVLHFSPYKIWPLFISSSSPRQRGMSRIMVLPASLAGKLKSSEKGSVLQLFHGHNYARHSEIFTTSSQSFFCGLSVVTVEY